MAQPADERVYSVTEARGRFSELIAAAEAGVTVVITRDGEPVVDMSTHRKPRRRIDVDWLRRQTAKIPYSSMDSGDLVRQMRDDDRY